MNTKWHRLQNNQDADTAFYIYMTNSHVCTGLPLAQAIATEGNTSRP